MFLTLDHVQIAAPDGCESAARVFYGTLLGLTELARPTALQNQGGLWFACGTLQVHIGVDPDFRPARKAHVAFRVEDLDSLQARFRVAGCEIVEDSLLPGVRRFFSYDPWGNRLEFVETTPRPQGDVA